MRVDSHIYQNYTVPPFYDSLISKIIVRANDREDTRIRLLRALDEMQISGIDTNIETHRNLINDEKFISGNFDINYLEEKFKPK